MHSRFFNGFGLASAWLVVSIVVFSAINAFATREVPLHVEDFRGTGMNDRAVVAAAVQEAFRVRPNGWWIYDKHPYLVFDTTRAYHFDPDGYETFRVEILPGHTRGTIGLLRTRY